MKKLMLLVVLLAFGVACQKAPQKDAAAAPAAKSAQAAPAAGPGAATSPAAAPAVKPVPADLPGTVAKVNGEAITREEFERALRGLEGRVGQPVPADRRDEVYRGMLDQMIAFKLLAQESKALNITVSEADIEGRVKALQSQFPDTASFEKALAEQKVTLTQLKADQRQQLLVDKVIERQVNAHVKVQETDITEFYKSNQDRMKQPENLRVAHILLTLPEKADAAAKAKTKSEAEAVLKQVKSGADFATLAKTKSRDTGTAQNGGELPPFGRGQMVPPFDEAAFKLKPGQTSGLVETEYGFHIIKMLERRPERVVPLDEARPRITEMLKQQQANEKGGAYIEQLKGKSKIQIFI